MLRGQASLQELIGRNPLKRKKPTQNAKNKEASAQAPKGGHAESAVQSSSSAHVTAATPTAAAQPAKHNSSSIGDSKSSLLRTLSPSNSPVPAGATCHGSRSDVPSTQAAVGRLHPANALCAAPQQGTAGSSGSEGEVSCPVCSKLMHASSINQHLDHCLAKKATSRTKAQSTLSRFATPGLKLSASSQAAQPSVQPRGPGRLSTSSSSPAAVVAHEGGAVHASSSAQLPAKRQSGPARQLRKSQSCTAELGSSSTGASEAAHAPSRLREGTACEAERDPFSDTHPAPAEGPGSTCGEPGNEPSLAGTTANCRKRSADAAACTASGAASTASGAAGTADPAQPGQAGPAPANAAAPWDIGDAVTMRTFIVGRRFCPPATLTAGQVAGLRREPDNKRDPNALQVVSRPTSEHIAVDVFGYLPALIVEHIAPLLAAAQIEARVTVLEAPASARAVASAELQVRIPPAVQQADERQRVQAILQKAAAAAEGHEATTLQRQSSGTGEILRTNFLLIADLVREQDGHLLTAEELLLLDAFKALGPVAQSLYLRLFQRRGPWFRVQTLNYSEVPFPAEAVQQLEEAQLAFTEGRAASNPASSSQAPGLAFVDVPMRRRSFPAAASQSATVSASGNPQRSLGLAFMDEPVRSRLSPPCKSPESALPPVEPKGPAPVTLSEACSADEPGTAAAMSQDDAHALPAAEQPQQVQHAQQAEREVYNPFLPPALRPVLARSEECVLSDRAELADVLNVLELQALLGGLGLLPRNGRNGRAQLVALAKDALTTPPVPGSEQQAQQVLQELLHLTGPCVRLGRPLAACIRRIQRLFFLNEGQDLSHFLVTDLGIMRYPSFRVHRTRPVFADRAALLEYEAALEDAAALDTALEEGDVEAAEAALVPALAAIAADKHKEAPTSFTLTASDPSDPSAPAGGNASTAASASATWMAENGCATSARGADAAGLPVTGPVGIPFVGTAAPSSEPQAHSSALARQGSASAPALPYLARFSAAWVFTAMATAGVSLLEKRKQYQEATELLRKLLGGACCPGRRGEWWVRLSVDTEHLGRVEEALEVAQSALADEWVKHGDRIALQRRILRLGKPPRRWKKPPWAGLVEWEPPVVQIEAQPLPNALGLKSKFPAPDGGECGVEELALLYYASEEGGGWQGTHSENGIWHTLFGLLLWDTLFLDVPDVFRTPFQTAPLDLSSLSFYPARKPAIQACLAQIRGGGAPEMLRKCWEAHHGVMCRGINWERHGLEDLVTIAECVGGRGLAAICQLLAEDLAGWSGGMPDLLLWKPGVSMSSEEATVPGDPLMHAYEGSPVSDNLEGHRPDPSGGDGSGGITAAGQRRAGGCAKLSEVKGPRDRLSEQQRAWIGALTDAGVAVEVLKVVEPTMGPAKRARRRKW